MADERQGVEGARLLRPDEELRALRWENRALRQQVEALEAGAPIVRCCDHCEACEAERDILGGRTYNEKLEAVIRDLPCYVARAGEGTYECDVDRLCPACSARHGLRRTLNDREETDE